MKYFDNTETQLEEESEINILIEKIKIAEVQLNILDIEINRILNF